MKFIDKYVKDHNPLGYGTGGKIFRCVNKESNETSVVKVYDKTRLNERRIDLSLEEARIGLSLPVHPNLVHVLDVFDETDAVMIVMEYIPGGTLYQHQIEIGSIREVCAARMLQHILQGLAVLHGVGVMHRDIKLENIFLRSNGRSQKLSDEISAIGDYGLATRTIPNSQCVGSPQYCAPEIALIGLQEHRVTYNQPLYNEKCDIWSVGVVAFVMLTGLLPFDGPTPTKVFAEVIKNMIPFQHPSCRNMSLQAKHFILRLTNSNPSKRPSAKEALRDTWLISCC
ncbi:unnamed protein product [Phytomonas sp. EM1]|nr:unnamed protein product [Phytomonas sp. EM1]|eukprot:CCW63599.1 unnamed protein product [Phytomonas sp. isolate EM1]